MRAERTIRTVEQQIKNHFRNALLHAPWTESNSQAGQWNARRVDSSLVSA